MRDAQGPGLLDRARSAGLRADADVRIDGAAVPSAIGAAAFRIVQEALTNVRKHAPGAATTVTVIVGDESLRACVHNGPPDALTPRPGIDVKSTISFR